MKQSIKTNLAERKAFSDVQTSIKNMENYFATLVKDVLVSRNAKINNGEMEVSKDYLTITYDDGQSDVTKDEGVEK